MKIQCFSVMLSPGSLDCPATVRVPAEDEASGRRKILTNRCAEKQNLNNLVYLRAEEREMWPS